MGHSVASGVCFSMPDRLNIMQFIFSSKSSWIIFLLASKMWIECAHNEWRLNDKMSFDFIKKNLITEIMPIIIMRKCSKSCVAETVFKSRWTFLEEAYETKARLHPWWIRGIYIHHHHYYHVVVHWIKSRKFN